MKKKWKKKFDIINLKSVIVLESCLKYKTKEEERKKHYEFLLLKYNDSLQNYNSIIKYYRYLYIYSSLHTQYN